MIIGGEEEEEEENDDEWWVEGWLAGCAVLGCGFWLESKRMRPSLNQHNQNEPFDSDRGKAVMSRDLYEEAGKNLPTQLA
jgi:hypothetical protein